MNRSWKTTLAGIIAGLTVLAATIANNGSLTDWQSWAVPVALAVLGTLAKDHDQSGPPVAVLLALCLPCFFTGCAGTNMPISAAATYEGTTLGYSSKHGLAVSIDIARLIAAQNRRTIDQNGK